jgi:hypothetical protein
MPACSFASNNDDDRFVIKLNVHSVSLNNKAGKGQLNNKHQ